MPGLWKQQSLTDGIISLPSTGQVCGLVGRELYIWGGRSLSNIEDDSTIKYNLDSATWSVIDTFGDVPGGFRSGSVALVYKRTIYIFGGHCVTDSYLNTLYAFNVDTCAWKLVEAKGVTPNPRDKHAGVVFGDKLYFFGGWGRDLKGSQSWSDELWEYDITRNTWTLVKTKGPTPSPRAAHTMTLVNDGMAYLIGGRSKEGRTNEVHRINLYDMTWSGPLLPYSRSPFYTPIEGVDIPCGRSWHISALIDGDRILVHGGMSNTNMDVDHTARALDDTWVFCIDEQRWKCVESEGYPRLWHSACVDTDTGSIMLLSGHSQLCFNQTHIVNSNPIAYWHFRPRSLRRLASEYVARRLSTVPDPSNALQTEIRRGSLSADAGREISGRIRAAHVDIVRASSTGRALYST
eukprot:CFRG4842T1